jgi:membrane protease YdiL (CAAX protease family)
MNPPDVALWLTFGLLGVAIAAVWLSPLKLSRTVSIAPWMMFFAMATASGVAAGFVAPAGVFALLAFAGMAHLTNAERFSRTWRTVFGLVTAFLALALALHKLPGFNNPQLIANVRFSPDAAPYTQYANFDKASVGLILLAFLCPRAATAADWRALLRRTLPIAAVTALGVMAIAMATGVVRPLVKWPAYTLVFLATNLLFTCVAEEAFFRGFVQDRLAAIWPAKRAWQIAVLVLSGVLFGLAHLGGGPAYALLATVAGVGYAYAFYASGRIEAAILTHFAFNAIHFIAFTYPAIARS